MVPAAEGGQSCCDFSSSEHQAMAAVFPEAGY